jgi:hypothetical protein
VADVMEKGDIDIGLASAAVECTRFVLAIQNQPELRAKMHRIAIKMVTVVRYFDELPPALLIGVVGLLSILARVLSRRERREAFESEEFQVVFQQALRGADDHVKSEVIQILDLVEIRG